MQNFPLFVKRIVVRLLFRQNYFWLTTMLLHLVQNTTVFGTVLWPKIHWYCVLRNGTVVLNFEIQRIRLKVSVFFAKLHL